MGLRRRVAGLLPRIVWLFNAYLLGVAGVAFVAGAVKECISFQQQVPGVPITLSPQLAAVAGVPLALLLASLICLFLAPQAGPNGKLLEVEPPGPEPRTRALRVLRRMLRALLRILYWLAFGLSSAVLFVGAGSGRFTGYILAVHGDKLLPMTRHTAYTAAFITGFMAFVVAILLAQAGGLLAGLDWAIRRMGGPRS